MAIQIQGLSTWALAPGHNEHAVGFLPSIFNDEDERSAPEQLNANYGHGGGCSPFNGFTLEKADVQGEAFLIYPEDPPMREVARCVLSDAETLILFDSSWLAIVNADGTNIVTRVD